MSRRHLRGTLASSVQSVLVNGAEGRGGGTFSAFKELESLERMCTVNRVRAIDDGTPLQILQHVYEKKIRIKVMCVFLGYFKASCVYI